MPRDLRGLPKLAEWLTFKGYRSSSPKEEDGNYMARGSENVMLTGAGKTQAFKGMIKHLLDDGSAPAKGGIVMMNVAEGYASLGQQTGLPATPPHHPALPADTEAYGNVFNVYNCLFYIGSGALRLNGRDLHALADSTLHLLVKKDGVYEVPPSMPAPPATGPHSAGLAQPSAPFIEAVTPPAYMTGKNDGVVSVVVWRIRSSTGAVSNHSEPSNIVAAKNQSIAVTFYGGDRNGQDYWGIGVTRNGEGAVGSYFEFMEVSEAEVAAIPGDPTDEYPDDHPRARTIVIEWADGDLVGREFAPFRDFPPPAGFYAGAVEDIVFVDGTYSDADADTAAELVGSAIAPSEPGKPESFSPDTVIFTNDFPTALIRGDGLYWRFGENSCYLIRYLGGEKPISVEIAWEGLGINFQHNGCIGEGGRLYIWANEHGLMRLTEVGSADGSFATDIADDLIGCDDPEKRVVGWDGNAQVVAFCYGTKIHPWFTALEAWGAPADIAESLPAGAYIRSCVTEDGVLLISDSKDNLYEYNAGSGSVMKVRTGWVQSARGMDNVTMVLASVRADNTRRVAIDVFADGDDRASVSSIEVTPARTGYQRLPAAWSNVIDCESHAIEISIDSRVDEGEVGDVGVESITTYGDAHSMVR